MIIEDFNEDNLNILLSFIDIYDSLTIDIIAHKIYYMDNSLKNIKLKENVKIQAYVDDMIVQEKFIEDLEDTYYKNTKDTIIDNDEGIDIDQKSVKWEKLNS